MTILFTGGGTMGPVTPLMAVLRRMRTQRPELTFAWAGTPDGPEGPVVKAECVRFYAIPVAKIPRHPSVQWFTWPFDYLRARMMAASVITKEKPILVVSAGGFTAVPVMKEARRRKIPCVIHQLDAEPGISNRAVAKHCVSVTTTFSYDMPPFGDVPTERIATPCRFAGKRLLSREDAAKIFGLDPNRQIVFIVGGGTGATTLNEAVADIQKKLLLETQIIHSTGKGKAGGSATAGYVMKEFMDENEMRNAYAAADLVVSRAGLGGISELACLSKAALFVPIPDNQQTLNVARLPCAVVEQGANFHERLLEKIRGLLQDPAARQALGQKLHDALPTDDGSALAEKWLKIIST